MAEQKAKVVHGPGPRGMGGPRPKVENPGKPALFFYLNGQRL